MPLISGTIGAILNRQAVGATNDANLQIARETNQFNSAEAQKNRDFQLEMSNTEIQRRMADLKAAGLNPYYAVEQGGASTPSGSTASGSAAHLQAPVVDMSSITPNLYNLLSSAYMLNRLNNSRKLMSSAMSILNSLNSAQKARNLTGFLKLLLK